MTYIIVTYTLLFLLTAALAFILGHWWARRRLVDVTESYETLTKTVDDSKAGWDRLWGRLEALDGSVTGTVKSQIAGIPQPQFPAVDFSMVESRLDALHAKIDNLPQPQPTDLSGLMARTDTIVRSLSELPAPEAPDLSGLERRLTGLQSTLSNLPTPDPIDLAPVSEQIEAVNQAVRDLPTPPPAPSLAGIETRLSSLEQRLSELPEPAPTPDLAPIESRLSGLQSALGALPEPEPVDLGPLSARVNALEALIRGIEMPQIPAQQEIDLAPLASQVTDLQRQIAALPSPAPATNLSPVNGRLSDIEAAIKALEARLAELNTQPEPEPTQGPQLLHAPVYGDPDDLKQISGVGPKLEKLLHKNGVYYFWQVASWSPEDVEFVDAQLEVFTGRIARDSWVAQANKLKLAPGAARKPD